jgi:hypothetical protein
MHAGHLLVNLISDVWHSMSSRNQRRPQSIEINGNDIGVTGQWGAGLPSSIHLFVNSMPSSLALCAVSKARPMQLSVRTRLMPSLSQHTTTLNFQRLPLLVGSSIR